MSEPDCPKKGPYVVDLQPGTYYWCSCGKSSKQPFCDGSHVGTDFAPVEIKIDTAGKVGLCGCKRTANPPRCDGTHSKL